MRISGRISMNPSWRKPVGMFLILGIIAVWAVIIASMAHQIARLPGAVQMVIYAVAGIVWILPLKPRSEEHTSELQSLMRISYAVFCLKKKKNDKTTRHNTNKQLDQ